jgi:meso-butanediol dehydrogenase/(S,S)-butanediol dehydrogenase/diacetyl reductase
MRGNGGANKRRGRTDEVARTIVITGAGLGLGRATARRFAAGGETVVLLGRTLSKVQALADELGGAAMAVACDVASPDSVREAFATIAAVHPSIDVLINNAGVYEPFTLAEGTDEQILSIINTNLVGPMFCTRSAIPLMQRGATIINVGSESVDLPFAMLSVYQASKAGLNRLTTALAAELKEAGIRVTMVRAGSMMDVDPQRPNWDPDAAMRFHLGCVKAGIDLRSEPVSSVASVTDVFQAVINLPPDVHLSHISVEARRP